MAGKPVSLSEKGTVMAAEVETMFSAREVPWHKQGVITAEALRTGEALVQSGLDWTVERQPIFQHTDKDGFLLVEGFDAYARSTDGKVLHVATPGYTPIQNSEMFAFAENLLDLDDGVRIETAGSLRGGRLVWATVRLNGDISINGDTVTPYLVLANSHDGSMAFKVLSTPVRVVCMNTLRMAMTTAKASWSVRHTESATHRVAEAKESLGLAYHYLGEWEKEVDVLMNTAVTDARFAEIVAGVFPELPLAATDREHRNREARVATVHNLWAYSPTIGEYRGTGWGTLNAVNEWEAWSTRHESPGVKTMARFQTRHLLRVATGDFPMTARTHAMLVAARKG